VNTDDNERWANTMLADAVGTEPELGFHPDDVLTRARRDRSRRRATITGAATITALVATGLLLDHGSTEHHPIITGAPPATETTIYGGSGDPMTYDAHAAALTATLADARLIPAGIRLSTDTSYGGQPLVFYKLITGQNTNSYYAQATITDQHGAGHLVIQVLRQQTGLNCVNAPSYWQPCESRVLADGVRITTVHYAPPQPGRPAIQWQVEVVRPDGTAVDVQCGNWSLDGNPATSGIGHATGAEPAIGVDTLVQLARLSGLRP